MTFGSKTSSLLKRGAAAIVAVAALVSFAACGTTDSSDESSSSSSATGYDVSGVQKVDKIAAMLPSDIADSGKLTAGMELSYAPAEFYEADGKTPTGYDVNLAQALGKVLGLDTQIVSSTFDTIVASVGSKYDIGITAMTITKEREEAVNFVSYFNAGSMWVVRKGNPDKVDTSDLCGMKIAVQTGTVQEDEANTIKQQCSADGKADVEVLSYQQQTEAATNVVSGKADVFYADSPVGGYAIEQSDGALEELGDIQDSALEGIAIAKDDEQLAKAIQAAMQQLMDDGTYTKILEAWGVESGAVKTAELNPSVD
ncbi:ABC transporter substrate-binding protein [Bifidobacterium choloepi]|uniref:ABC transporter substrate-binding protein n=1 Tax=Bifidobacterium choloepi TaxID=2614131 RepID=A0A6I5N1G9_9BIFI|nr:ABC transporter substrate-binding protein [Bifidobacterium choloepi]NEG69479.1 ABC transporter substrate-binding protein [Bifidobacterium choloepi]